MKTMTIRNIPDDVAANLAAKAKAENRSVNATVFCGVWSKEEADTFEKIIEESFERIDPEDWK